MKKWTIEFELLEGSDEFFESNPSPSDIIHHVKNNILDDSYASIQNIRITSIIDTTIYEDEPELEDNE